MNRTFARYIVVLALLLVGSARGAVAQTTATGTSSITIGTVLYIAVTNTTVGFPTVTDAHYTAGYVTGSALSAITTKGNSTHSVTVKANASTMTATGTGARANKPSTDLQVRSRPASGSYGSLIGLTTTGQNVITSRAAGDYSASLYEVEYRVILSWGSDTPGTYTLGTTYTIIAG